jgi:hypothetical protein
MTKLQHIVTLIEMLEQQLMGVTHASIDLRVQAVLREMVLLKIQLEKL